jgi:membrane protease YdiL (CAAX protease family)
MRSVKNREKYNDMKKALLFIFITYSISWSIWFFAPNAGIEIIGSIMPSIIGFFFLRLDKSGTYKNFKHRIINLKLVRLTWILIILLIIPFITFISVIIQKLLGGDISSSDTLIQNVRSPLKILVFVLLGLGAGFGEEMGWRGFLLDTFQKYWSGLTSSVITGVVWAAWHIPLALMKKESLFSLFFINYIIFVILLSVLITVIYDSNNRSILSAILLHGMVNITQYMAFINNPIPIGQDVIRTICLLIIVIGIILVCKTKAPITFNMIESKTQKQVN